MHGRYKLRTVWHVGLIPALISGVLVYIVIRWYENDGFTDGLAKAAYDWEHYNKQDRKSNTSN